MFGISNTTDAALVLLKDLGINEDQVSDQLKALSQTDSRYLRDLRINVTNALASEQLTKKEAFLLSFSIAVNEKNIILQNAFRQSALAEGSNEKEIAEVISCTSLLAANNVYYRFRHFMEDEFYNNAQAGIRMSIMANPLLGKEFFELVSLAVSAVNGCELCVTSHEKALTGHGTSKQRIHDAVKLAAVIKSLTIVI